MPSQRIAREAQRGFTDPCAAVMYFVCWGFLLSLATVAFKEGSPARFLRGTDLNGNMCESSSDVLWFPLRFDSRSNSFDVSSALRMGLCVPARCPHIGDPAVATYGSAVLPATIDVTFNSSAYLGRCIPDISSYQCGLSTSCVAQRSVVSATSDVLTKMGIGDFFFGFVTQMSVGWAMICTLSIVCVVLCFMWLWLLRLIVKPLVFLTCFLFLGLLVLVGTVGLYQRHHVVSEGDEQSLYTTIAVIGYAAAVAFFCIFLYLYKDIVISCDIIVESTRVIGSSPLVLVVPVVQSALLVSLSVFFCFVALNVYTSETTVPQTASFPSLSNTTLMVPIVTFVGQDWRGIGQFFNVFMFLWTMGVVHAATIMIVSLVAAQWYWSSPNDDKSCPSDAIRWSIKTTFLHHIGTIVFGSFLLAVVQFLRLLLRLLENRLRQVTQKQVDVVSVVLCCAECLLACFERIVKFLTKNAYVMCAITGDALIPAGRQAFALLTKDVKVLTVDIISDVVITIGKLVITLFVLAMGYAWMQNNAKDVPPDGATPNVTVILITQFVITYFITSMFASVFHVSLDTVLISYCYDRDVNDGVSRPYYAPSSLQTFVDAAALRKTRSDKGDVKGVNESQPLVK